MSQQDAERTNATLDEIIATHSGREGPLLPMLHDIQHAFGFIPEAAVGRLADALNLSRAEVTGVISFYHDFRKKPAGRHVLKVCRSEACQSVGGEAMAERILGKLGLGWGGTTENGALTVEPVYCLGLCACAPAVMLDERVLARVDDARIDRILTEAGA